MKIKTSGFTLMEIMVVIIVVAVLASVAGPMIGSVTDQGRESATKSKMSSLKSAIIAYKNDIGRYPSCGDPKKALSYDASKILQDTEEGNVLATDEWDTMFSTAEAGDKVPEATYSKKWTGPYMDSLPADFMFDSWGNRIQYLVHDKNLYLWSPGADNIYNVTNFPNGGTDDNDDIVVSIARFRTSFQKKSQVIDLNGNSAVLDFSSATSFPGTI